MISTGLFCHVTETQYICSVSRVKEVAGHISGDQEETHPDYKKWLKVLLDHYLDLLGSEGDSFEALIRNVYKTKTNYLLFINHLNRVEMQFNAALEPSLSKTTEGVNQIVSSVEKCSKQLRLENAEPIFP
jgi:ABC-type enterochelin transport system ATPase subunit